MRETHNRKQSLRHPGRLFRRRVATHWKNQISALRSVADWTVMLYILVPGLLLGGGLYRELWTTPLPAWMELIPYQAAAALLLYMLSGSILLFVEEADALFLRQQPHWIKGLMGRGIAYSFSVFTVKGLLFTLIALPVLVRKFGLDAWDLAGWGLLAAGVGWTASLIVHRTEVRYRGIKKWLLSASMRLASLILYLVLLTVLRDMPLVAAVSGSALLAVSGLLAKKRCSEQGTFDNDVREDLRIRARLTDKVLTQAVGRPPRIRSKVWLFRRSGRLYRSSAPDKRFADAGVKAFLRQSESLLIYVQFLGAGIPAVLLPPVVVKMIVYAALMLLLANMLQLRWRAFAESDFAAVLPFTGIQQMRAGTLAVRTLMAVPVLVLSVVFGLSMWPGWEGLLAGVPIAAASVAVFPPFLSRPSLNRKDE
ncbi:ABC transporter permease [Paenibacillus sp. DMB20]|uniref:ABC transporter permease n=1 Tax=Paenibacillus sp. DMB20 TaxID=1642570 RepID=UPI0006279FE0|nr:ABC transporter permease [Paenibacillus sp. DMB20]KKO50832.1 hypothetical protein XI25_29865 [Paenibacillus sp. DMB20]